jgi:hypothetical protein
MTGCYSAIIDPLVRRLGRRDGGEPSREFQILQDVSPSLSRICSQSCESIGPNNNRRHSPIRILNNDTLLNIFHLYRLADPDEYAFAWPRQDWWYKLAHICRLWRNIILQSPSRLDLHLFCTNGVPVADMLAHSPPLPLTIYYHNLYRWGMTAEEESGLLLALSSSYRDRVHHIDFWELQNVDKLVAAMDDQFPILERMYISSRNQVALPVSFQAPNLRHLKLWTASIPIGSSLLSTTASLVTLSLLNIPASANFPPSYILTRISMMVQLERLSIEFQFPLPGRDVEGQTPDMITLPNLQRFEFHGVSTYLESLVSRISAPSLNTLQVYLYYQPSLTVPRLLQFMQASKNFTFSAVKVTFDVPSVSLYAAPWKCDTPLLLKIWSRPLDSQVRSAAQLLRSLSRILSVVEQVTISYRHKRASEWHNNADQIQWRELLRPFTNVKAIHVQDHLVGEIFRCLISDEGKPPLELLPNLEEVGYLGGSDVRDAFTTFLNERRVTGHPVSLRLVNPSIFDDDTARRVLHDKRHEWVLEY